MDTRSRKSRFRTRLFMALVSGTGVLLLCALFIDTSARAQSSVSDSRLQSLFLASSNFIPFSSLSPQTSATSPNQVEPRSCRPHNNVMFLKTHKCASSTVQNMLMRYGDSRNLTFVLPESSNYLGHPTKFNSSLAIPLPSVYCAKEYNIFCHHTRFDKIETEKIMPKDTIYVSILKEPAAMYESLYNWVELDQRYGVPLEKFLASPMKYYRNNSNTVFARNPMSFDFGLEEGSFESPSAIWAIITEIDERFSLIMLAEFMDESIVLLKELLCWSWDDITVFRINARRSEYKTELTKELQEKIRQWNFADTNFYTYFKRKFANHIESYGTERMQTDVGVLRRLTKRWFDFCVQNRVSKNETTDIRFKVWHQNVDGFQLTPAGIKNRTCIQLATAENPFTDYLRLKLWPKLKEPDVKKTTVDPSWILPGYW